MTRAVLLGVQAVTYFALTWVLFHDGDWRLGVAQFLLGIVTVLIYL